MLRTEEINGTIGFNPALTGGWLLKTGNKYHCRLSGNGEGKYGFLLKIYLHNEYLSSQI